MMNPDLEWQRRYEENDTPWDKGVAAPALLDYLKRESISGRVLVPGCGRGHEVRALGRQPGTTAVGLDVSPLAIEQARKLTDANVENVQFVEGDFFNLPPGLTGSFDWVVEHTCFCAIEPRLRTDYVRAASGALRGGGKFFGIFYINPDVEEGPPFRVSRDELGALFEPAFIGLEEWTPAESFPGREGRELVWVLRKR